MFENNEIFEWFSKFKQNTKNAIERQISDRNLSSQYVDELCGNVLEFLSLLRTAGYCNNNDEHKLLCQRIYGVLDHIEFLPQGSSLYGNCESGCVQIGRDLSEDKRRD